MSFQYLLIFLNLNYAPMSTQRVLDMISDYNPRQKKAECFCQISCISSLICSARKSVHFQFRIKTWAIKFFPDFVVDKFFEIAKVLFFEKSFFLFRSKTQNWDETVNCFEASSDQIKFYFYSYMYSLTDYCS